MSHPIKVHPDIKLTKNKAPLLLMPRFLPIMAGRKYMTTEIANRQTMIKTEIEPSICLLLYDPATAVD
jgi:hypothetical protein